MSRTHRKIAAQNLSDSLEIPYQTALKAIIEAYPTGPDQRQQSGEPSVKESAPAGGDYHWDALSKEGFTPAPSDYSAYSWTQFPLGVDANQEEVVLDVSRHAHVLIGGRTGAGKTVALKNIVNRALASEKWQVTAVDVKRVELSGYAGAKNFTVVTEMDDAIELLSMVVAEMQRRYEVMDYSGLTYFPHDELPAILLVMDEVFPLFEPEGILGEKGEMRDQRHALARELASDIARMGRPAGIHLVLATQHPTARSLSSEMRSNIDARIAVGSMDVDSSRMILNNDAATHLPPTRGNAVLRIPGEEGQGFRLYRPSNLAS